MKTFKRALSCFLVLLMIFSSFSILSATAADDKSVTVITKFFAENESGKWEEVTEVKPGATVKARVYFDSNYNVGVSNLFWVYSKNFMDIQLDGWAQTGVRYEFPNEKNPVINPSATSFPTKNGWGGSFTTATTPGGSASEDAADCLVLDGYLSEEYFDDKGWVALRLEKGAPPEVVTDDEYLFEFTFKVKDNPEGEGFFYLEEEAIQDTGYYDYAYTYIGAAKATSSFVSTPGYGYDYTYNLQDKNTITLAKEVTPTTYAVTYSYAGDVPAGYTAPEAIELETGADITEPTGITIPDGYTLTWTMSGDVNGKMGTAPVTMTGTWVKTPVDDGRKRVTVITKFFAENEGGEWEEVSEVKPGATVKARIYFNSNYNVGVSNLFWVYSKNFMDIQLDGWAQTGVRYEFPNEKNPVINPSATSFPTKNGWGGSFTTATTPGGSASEDAADCLVLDGYLSEEYFDDKGWVALRLEKGAPPEVVTDDEYLFEFTFKVKDNAEGVGFFYLEEEAIQDTDYYDYAYTYIGAAKATSSFVSTPGYGYDYVYDLQDKKTITLAKEVTPTTYAVNYVYAGDVPAGITAPTAIQLETGANIEEPTGITIPDGYTLTWSMSGAVDGKMGTAPVTMTGTWAKKSNTVTYVYAGETPDGKTAPEAITLKYGEAITEPTVEIPEGYTLTWTGIPASGKMGLEAVTLTGTWAKKSNTVTYVYAGETPDGKTAPEAITLKYGEAITEPTVEIPEGYTLTWTGIPASGKMGLEAVTLTGTWAKIEYNVTYTFDGEYPGEAIEPAAGKTTVGATIPAPAVEVPAGWTVEWNVTGATKNADGSYTAGANDVAFVATFSKIEYTITYYLSETDKAEGKVYGTQNYTVGDEIVALGAPEAEAGKAFIAWDFESSEGIFDETMPMPAENLSAVATWEDIEYYVTFYDVWGDNITEIGYFYGDEITDADLPSEDDAKAGEDVDFIEWQLNDAELATPYVVTEDLDIYAYCTVDIIYYADEEMTKVHKTYTFDFGHLITEDDLAELGEPTKFGHDFDGWDADYVDQEATANNYAAPTFVPNNYDVTFIVDGEEFKTDNVTFGEVIEAPATVPTPEGYTFKGWTDVEGGEEALDELVMDAEGKTFYPVFVENGKAAYTVEFYLMGTDGKYADTTEDKATGSATFGTSVTVAHADYAQDAWFSADTSEDADNVYTGVIAEDGSTVLKLYYKRAQYDVTIDGAEAVKVYHGAEVTAPATSTATPAGYELASWNNGAYAKGEVITVTGPLTLTPDFTEGTTTYTVKTYTMGLDGEYGAATEETFEAATGATVTYAAPVKEGFTADKESYSVEVKGDGTSVIEVRYIRNQYDVVIDGAEAVKVYYGATVTAPETSTATPAGYELASWNNGAIAKGATIKVTGPVTLTPDFAPATSEYTINTYTMGLDGEYGAAVSETKEYTTDETVTYTAPAKEGFTADKESYTVKVTGDGLAVIDVYYARDKYDVTIDGVTTQVFYEAEITAPETSTATPAGYELASWNNGAIAKGATIKVTGPVTLTPDFAPATSEYTINTYTMGLDGEYGAAVSETKTATTDTEVTYTAPVVTGFTADKESYTVKVTGDGLAAIDVYYARDKYDVVIDGAEAVKVYYGATVTAPETSTATPAGYTLASWNNGAYAKGEVITVTGPLTLTPDFTEGTTAYTVEIYLQNVDGSYDAVASKTEDETGKTGDTVTIAHADYAQESYYLADDAQANEFTGTIAGDGSLVLKLFYKRATYDVIVDGEVVAEDVIHGAEITLPEESDNITEGNELAGWTDGKNTYEPGETIIVDGPIELVPVEKPGDATKYTISIYVMDVNGEYVGTSTVAYGTTGATQTLVADYGREGFTVDTTKSKLTGVIAGDGSLELSVYYARNLYTATFDGVDYQVYYGASLPVVEPAAQEGKEFDTWTPALPEAMPAEDLEFTSTWTDVMYKLIYIINGTEEEYEYAVGAAVTPIADPVVPGMTFIKWNKTIPTVMPAEDVIIVAEFEAAVFKATFVDGDGNVFDEKAVKYGDSIVLPASNPTKDYHVFKGWLDVPATMPATNITIQPIFERVPVRLVAVEGSTTVIDRETGIITGLTTRMNDTIAAQYLAVEGDGYYTITAVGNYSRYGTGAKVEVFDRADTSAPIETFYIVIYGDLNGDGDISASDASIVENEVLYVTQWSWGSTKDAVKVMAADLVKDGYIQTNDADAIVNTTLGIASIDQATGTVVR